jgi:hypothetical protein
MISTCVSPLSEALVNVIPVATYADLLLVTAPTETTYINMLGYYAKGDGGGGPFYFDTTSTATDNAGTVIKPTAVDSGSPGRWLKLPVTDYARMETITAASRTLTLTDLGKVLLFNSASAQTCVMPQDSTEDLPDGFICVVIQAGAGQVTFADEGSDVTYSADSLVATASQHSAVTVLKQASAIWRLSGGLG